MVRVVMSNRELLLRLTQREIAARYRGSALGLAWSVLTPLLMLLVYTIVFSQLFQTRFGGQASSSTSFAIMLFAGLICFGIFSETVADAPKLVVGNPNYVSKVVFPLEVLSFASVGKNLFNALMSLIILLVFQLLFEQRLALSIVWLPLVWLPFLAFCLAFSLLLAAASVFVRDIGQVTSVVTNMLFYLSAVFYPVEALPESWRSVLLLNPLVTFIDQTRRVVLDGVAPSSWYLLVATPIALLFCEWSLRVFQRAKRGFADVL